MSRAVVAVLFLSLVGFIDASYLTASHYLRIPLPCSIVNGCERVTTSVYATVWGIPIALAGALYYFFMLICSVAAVDIKNFKLMRLVSVASSVGFLASLALVSIQLFVLDSICLYCMVSAVTTTAIFALSVYFFPLFSHEGEDDQGDKTQDH